MEILILKIDKNQSKITYDDNGKKEIQIKQAKKSTIKLEDLREGMIIQLGNHPSGKKCVDKIISKKTIKRKVIAPKAEKLKENIKFQEKNFDLKIEREIGKSILDKYPYNFIKSDFSKCIRDKYEKGNNTGYIDLKVINTSPLLIAESEIEKKKEHIKKNGKYIIPASSFKGMLRGYLEAVTNSCYSTMEGRDEVKTLTYRLDFMKSKVIKNLESFPGRVIKKEGKFYVERLESAWINDKILKEDDKKELNDIQEPKKKVQHEIAENNGWESSNKRTGKIKRTPGVSVVYCDLDKNKIKKTLKKRWGYVKDTGINFGNKHHQRFFYEGDKSYKDYELSEAVCRKYAVNIEKQNEENKNNYITEAGSNKFKTTYRHTKVRDGALVWAILNTNKDKVVSLSYVETPKIAYEKDAMELLNELEPCNTIENLCYGCRIFGATVEKDEEDENQISAVQGKVLMDDLKLITSPKVCDKFIRMDILDSAKPSNANFYVDKNYNSYDDIDATLRGRKVFWHHKDKQDIHDTSQLEMTNIINKNASESQSTEIKPLFTGNLFTGRLYIKDMTDIELGALLFTLGEKDTFHKIGAGKPLGMGSIKIHDIKLKLESKDKYISFDSAYEQVDTKDYIDEFKNDMSTNFKVKFEDLNFIREYRRLTESMVDFSKENYPTAINDRTGDRSTMQWFMKKENKTKKLEELLQYK